MFIQLVQKSAVSFDKDSNVKSTNRTRRRTRRNRHLAALAA